MRIPALIFANNKPSDMECAEEFVPLNEDQCKLQIYFHYLDGSVAESGMLLARSKFRALLYDCIGSRPNFSCKRRMG